MLRASATCGYARSDRGIVLLLLGGRLVRRHNTPHDRPVHLVGQVDNFPVVVLLADGKCGQIAFLVEGRVAVFTGR